MAVRYHYLEEEKNDRNTIYCHKMSALQLLYELVRELDEGE